MNENQEYFKQNNQRNSKSRNNRYWYSADPIDAKADKSGRAMHRARLAKLLEDGAFEVTV